MKMIIGGAFQGKYDYAKAKYPQIHWINGKEAEEAQLWEAEGIVGFHEFIRKELKAGREVQDLAKRLMEKNPEIVLISDEVGYGVVPLDAFERKFRESVGRVCTELAAYSSEVTRVICGIGTVIKGA